MNEPLVRNNELLDQVVTDATKIGRSLYEISRHGLKEGTDSSKILPPRFTNLNNYKKGSENYNLYHRDSQSRINDIDFDWAIITLMKLIDISYKNRNFSCHEEEEYVYEVKKWRIYIVRALQRIYLLKNSSQKQYVGKCRDFGKLFSFIVDCLFLERAKEHNDVALIWGDPDEFYSTIVFAPKVPVEEDINSLLSDLSCETLAKVIDIIWYGINIDDNVIKLLFKESRILKHIPTSGAGKDIWFGLHMRLSLLLNILKKNHNNLTFGNKNSFLNVSMYSCTTKQKIVYTSLNYYGLCLNSCSEDSYNLFPLYILGEYVWFSPRILEASISLWLSQEIDRNSDIREKAISGSFELKVINLLRRNNYIAGEVTQNGFWRNDQPGEDLSGKQKSGLTGQIDILARNGKGDLIVLECKSVKPFGNPRNVAGKIRNDDSSWRRNLAKKIDWVENIFKQKISYSAIVQEGYIYKDPSEDSADIPVINFNDLEKKIIITR